MSKHALKKQRSRLQLRKDDGGLSQLFSSVCPSSDIFGSEDIGNCHHLLSTSPAARPTQFPWLKPTDDDDTDSTLDRLGGKKTFDPFSRLVEKSNITLNMVYEP